MQVTRNRITPAWLGFALIAALGLAGFVLFARNAGTVVPASWGVSVGSRSDPAQWINAFQQIVFSPMITAALAALILARHPGHRIGRLLMFLGLTSALGGLASEWAVYGAFTAAVPPPGTFIAAWVTNWIWVFIFGPLILTGGLFPDGRFVSRRWAGLILGLILLLMIPVILAAMIETPMSSAFQIPNPFVREHRAALYNGLFDIGVVAMPLSAVAVLASAVVRYRTSRARERQQMKWLLAGVAVMALMTVGGLGLSFALDSRFGELLVNTAVLGPVLGVGVALLRYRLYDIDVFLRRTLVYAILTALLAGLYFSGIVLLQSVFQGVTGSRESPLITVITTLVIAALFSPLRTRVQGGIDRRFYRSKYDAERTIAQFAAAARDEVDLDLLAGALLGVVENTMRPQAVTLWLEDYGKD
jgi:hypothetical protein